MSDFSTEDTKPEATEEVVPTAVAEAPADEAPAVVDEPAVVEPVVIPAPEPERKAEKKAEKKAPAKAAGPGRSYKRGDAGVDVRTFQKFLNTKGFSCPETGIFCSYTHDEVKKYQKSAGLEENGVITEDMLALAE